MKEYLYKNLAKYGFIGVVAFIILAILIFNHYWSALGVNPKTTNFPEITKDYKEFKDYTTLIFYLISAIGSLSSSILIILFYDAWKEQHNRTLLSTEAKQLLEPLLKEQKLLLCLEEEIHQQYKIKNNRFTLTDNKLVEIFNEYKTTTTTNNLSHAFFNFLAKKRTSDLYNKYLKQGGKLINFHNECSIDLKSYSSVKEELQKLLDELKLDIQNLTNDLKSYILIK